MSTEQPRQPAGSPDGGQFAATPGAEAATDLQWEGLPDKVVTVRGGLAESNGSVRIMDLDVLDDAAPIQEDWVFGVLLADVQVLRNNGHDYDADRLENHIKWHGPITPQMREEAARNVAEGAEAYAVIEGGLVQYTSDPGVTVIDMDVTDSSFSDSTDVKNAREIADDADKAGVPALAQELRDWADDTEARLAQATTTEPPTDGGP